MVHYHINFLKHKPIQTPFSTSSAHSYDIAVAEWCKYIPLIHCSNM